MILLLSFAISVSNLLQFVSIVVHALLLIFLILGHIPSTLLDRLLVPSYYYSNFSTSVVFWSCLWRLYGGASWVQVCAFQPGYLLTSSQANKEFTSTNFPL